MPRRLSTAITDILFCTVSFPPPDAPIYAEFELNANEEITSAKVIQGVNETSLAFSHIKGGKEYWTTPGPWALSTLYTVTAEFERTLSPKISDRAPTANNRPGSIGILSGGDIESIAFDNTGGTKSVKVILHLPTGFGANPALMELWEDDGTGLTNTNQSFSNDGVPSADRKRYKVEHPWTGGFLYEVRATVIQTPTPLTKSETSWDTYDPINDPVPVP